MKKQILVLFLSALFAGCARLPVDEGPAALVVYEPTAGDVRSLSEATEKPYVKLYSDYVVISYSRTDEKQGTRHFTHVIPANKLGFLRWADPNKR